MNFLTQIINKIQKIKKIWKNNFFPSTQLKAVFSPSGLAWNWKCCVRPPQHKSPCVKLQKKKKKKKKKKKGNIFGKLGV
jgi:hypothetical protein